MHHSTALTCGCLAACSTRTWAWCLLGVAFMKKHKTELCSRMRQLSTILLHLRDANIVNGNEEEEVQGQDTSQRRNRVLLEIAEKKGPEAQEQLYQIPRVIDPYLSADPEKSSWSWESRLLLLPLLSLREQRRAGSQVYQHLNPDLSTQNPRCKAAISLRNCPVSGLPCLADLVTSSGCPVSDRPLVRSCWNKRPWFPIQYQYLGPVCLPETGPLLLQKLQAAASRGAPITTGTLSSASPSAVSMGTSRGWKRGAALPCRAVCKGLFSCTSHSKP